MYFEKKTTRRLYGFASKHKQITVEIQVFKLN